MANRVGVCAIPNRCSSCGRFKPWDQLVTHFVPDSDYSSEDQSWRECLACIKKKKAEAENGRLRESLRGLRDCMTVDAWHECVGTNCDICAAILKAEEVLRG